MNQVKRRKEKRSGAGREGVARAPGAGVKIEGRVKVQSDCKSCRAHSSDDPGSV